MHSNQIPIVFFFPYRGVGGVSVLFLRLASLLSAEYPVILIDYEDGYMAKRVPKGVRFLPLTKLSELEPNSVIILQTTPVWRIEYFSKLPDQSRVFFWNLHPRNIQGMFFPNNIGFSIKAFANKFSTLRTWRLRNYIQFLIDNKAIAFMDEENLSVTERSLAYKFYRALLLPIITDEPDGNLVRTSYACGVLDALWIGRIEGFKTPVLKRLILDLLSASKTAVRLRVVGCGADRVDLESFSKDLRDNFEIEFLGELEGPALTENILSSDIGFCMGASALEMAKYSIPIVCLDYSYERLEHPLQYQFLYEVEGFNLARELSSHACIKGRTLEELLSELNKNGETIGSECKRYWEENHSPRNISKILDTITNTTVSVRMIKLLGYDQPDIFTRIINLALFILRKKVYHTDVYKI